MACLTLVQDGQIWVGVWRGSEGCPNRHEEKKQRDGELPTPHFPGAVFEKREKEMKER